MIKRIFLCLMLFSCLFINVYAETIKEDSAVVKVGDVETPVYEVEVTWGKMEFVYTEQINYVWDEDKHIYSLGNSTYNWVSEDNYVEVNNKSYTKINVELEYVSLKNNISGTFDNSNQEIESNSKSRFTLNLSGRLDSSSLNYTKVGSINLKIS